MFSFVKNMLSSIRNEGSLAYNITWSFSSKAGVTILGLLLTPIFTRLYTPEDYGIFSAYSLIINNFMVVASLGFAEALIFVSTRKTFCSILVISAFFSLISVLILSFIIPNILSMFGFSGIQVERIKTLVIVGSLMTSSCILLQKMNVFENKFKRGSTVGIIQAISNRSMILGFGLNNIGKGFLYSDIFSKAIASGLHSYYYLKIIYQEVVTITIPSLIRKFLEYKRYPLMVMPAHYLRILLEQFLSIFIGAYFGLEQLGQFGLALGLIFLPINIIGNSIQTSFVRRVRDIGDVEMLNYINKVFLFVAAVTLLPSVLFSFLAKDILPFVLGDQWGIAAEYGSILILWLFFGINEQVIGSVYQLKKRENQILIINLLGALFMGLILWIIVSNNGTSIQLVAVGVILRIILSVIRLHFVAGSLVRRINLVVGLLICILIYWIGLYPH